MLKYFYRLGLAGSLFLSALFGGRAYESVCAKAWRQRNHDNPVVRFWSWLTIHFTNLFEDDHCLLSWRWHQVISKAIKRVK